MCWWSWFLLFSSSSVSRTIFSLPDFPAGRAKDIWINEDRVPDHKAWALYFSAVIGSSTGLSSTFWSPVPMVIPVLATGFYFTGGTTGVGSLLLLLQQRFQQVLPLLKHIVLLEMGSSFSHKFEVKVLLQAAEYFISHGSIFILFLMLARTSHQLLHQAILLQKPF